MSMWGLVVGIIVGAIAPAFFGIAFISFTTFIGVVIGGMLGMCVVILSTTW
jgi:hypothetical protein